MSGRHVSVSYSRSRSAEIAGALLVGDATLRSSTAGGVESLRRLWDNVIRRPTRAA